MRALIAFAFGFSIAALGCTSRELGTLDAEVASDASIAKHHKPARRDTWRYGWHYTDDGVLVGQVWTHKPHVADAGMLDAEVEMDAAQIEPDAAEPIEDAATPLEDAAVPEPDATIPDASSCEPWTDLVVPDPPARCMQEPPPDVGPFGHRIALTFDDGPNPATTPQVLAILREERIPATFFIVGQRLQNPQNQAIALDIHRDPLFRVANHSYTHPHMTTLDLDAVRVEVEQTSAALRAAVQDPCYFPRFFRFPHSETDCDRVELVRERGFAVTGYHIDALDWCYAAMNGTCPQSGAPYLPEQYRSDMVGYIVSQLPRYDGGIVLMHDIHANTVANLPAVIDALREAGMTFVALDDLALFPMLNAEADPPEPPLCCNGATR